MIEKVVEVEAKEVEEEKRITRTLKPHLFPDTKPLVGQKRTHKTIDDPSSDEEVNSDDSDAEEENDDDDEGLERVNKPVSRLNKLTKTERNAKLMRKMRHKEQIRAKQEKEWNKQFNKLPIIVKDYE